MDESAPDKEWMHASDRSVCALGSHTRPPCMTNARSTCSPEVPLHLSRVTPPSRSAFGGSLTQPGKAYERNHDFSVFT